MGLDIYAYALEAGATEGEEIHYWRKHLALAEWCSKLAVERGDEAWNEPAQSIELTSADLDRLMTAVRNRELKADYGIDWMPDDLAFIEKARAALAAGKTVEIFASW